MAWYEVLWNNGLPMVQWTVVLLATGVAAMTDLASRRIPNLLTVPVFGGGLLYAWMVGGWAGVADGGITAVVLAVPYVLLFLFARGGAGDAKLMAAIGAWLGMINGIAALGAIAVAGIILAIVWAAKEGRAREAAANIRMLIQSLVMSIVAKRGVAGSMEVSTQAMLTMPYGVAIFLGAVAGGSGVLWWRYGIL